MTTKPLSPPDMDREFYEIQNNFMVQRYKLICKKNKISWSLLWKNAEKELFFNPYLIWNYLCGLELFFGQTVFTPEEIEKDRLSKLKIFRIFNITDKLKKDKEYVQYLNRV